jgi:hypothetical protein
MRLPAMDNIDRAGRREACCVRMAWLGNLGPQELPDLPGGLGRLGGAEQSPGTKAARRSSSVGGAWLALAFRRSLRASIKSCMAWLGIS